VDGGWSRSPARPTSSCGKGNRRKDNSRVHERSDFRQGWQEVDNVEFYQMPKAPIVAAVALAGGLGLLVQPTLGKLMLPSLGGGSGVWTTVAVFFQGMLLLGYIYAGLLQRARAASQKLIHLTIGTVGLSLFLTAPEPPSGGAGEALVFLTRAIGFAALFIYSTSPLIQGWLSSAEPHAAAGVYRLFAVSNFTAAVALVMYPFLLERLTSVERQLELCAGLYGLLLVCSAIVCHKTPLEKAVRRISLQSRWDWRWWAMPMASTVFMLSSVARFTRDTSPVPLIWVSVLSLYLFSYTLVFSFKWKRGFRAVAAAEVPIAAAAIMILLSVPIRHDWPTLLLLALSFFCICTFIHGELSASKPSGERLPSFYVAMAAGGFAGGVVMLSMPSFLDVDLELFIILPVVAAFSILRMTGRHAPRVALACAVATLAGGVGWGIKISTSVVGGEGTSVLTRGRTFFGTYRVEGQRGQNVLIHNGTVHGAQSTIDADKLRPTAYYAENGPLGIAWRSVAMPHNMGGIRAGAVGMGAGTLASYADSGDKVIFFEVDKEIADEMPKYFSFIDEARRRGAEVEIMVGDGRKVLESLPGQQFDILVVDAFSGDSVPAHLLSAEAFREYARHLSVGGVLAVHASNRIIDVPSVARGGAAGAGLAHVTLEGGDGGLGVRSEWVICARSTSGIERIKKTGGGGVEVVSGDAVEWTDKFSDIVSAMK